MGKFLIPCDFIVLDIDEDPPILIIMGLPFLATTGAVIDVPMGKLPFQLCGEKIDFCFPSSTPIALPVREIPTAPNSSKIHLSDGDGITQRNSYTAFELPPLVRTCSEDPIVHAKVVINDALPLEVPFSLHPPSPSRNT